jgi:putative redox protein
MADEITVRYQDHLRCEATRNKTGKTVLTDVTADHGGLDDNFSPVELAAAALGACTMSVMSLVAERSGVNIAGMQIEESFEMVSTPSHRIGAFKLIVQLPNAGAISESVRQKIEAAARACPVKNSLHPDIKVDLEFVYGS